LRRIATGNVTNAGLKNLDGLSKIESLDFWWENVAVDDAGLVHLEALPKLRRLEFRMTAITDKGLERLAEKLPQLESLLLFVTKTTASGVERFKHARPKCEVRWCEHFQM
jgi:hypothetical protein